MKIHVVRSSGGGKGNIVGGIIIAAVFGLATLGCVISGEIEDMFGVMVICALITMGGISLIVKGVQMNRRSKDNHPTHEFDMDAPDFVKERLNELMFEGNGGTTTVSKTVKRVTYTGPDGVTRTTETITQNGGNVNAPKGYHSGAITCQACGGVNKLRRGQSGVCEYCGSHIQG